MVVAEPMLVVEAAMVTVEVPEMVEFPRAEAEVQMGSVLAIPADEVVTVPGLPCGVPVAMSIPCPFVATLEVAAMVVDTLPRKVEVAWKVAVEVTFNADTSAPEAEIVSFSAPLI